MTASGRIEGRRPNEYSHFIFVFFVVLVVWRFESDI